MRTGVLSTAADCGRSWASGVAEVFRSEQGKWIEGRHLRGSAGIHGGVAGGLHRLIVEFTNEICGLLVLTLLYAALPFKFFRGVRTLLTCISLVNAGSFL